MRFISWIIGLFMGAVISGLVFFSVVYKQGPSGNAYQVQQSIADPPPDYLNINGERWAVLPYDFPKDTTGYSEADGASDCPRRLIWYTTEKRTSAEIREDLWHEIGHASLCNQGSTRAANWSGFVDGTEHQVVYPFGMFMPSFVHDNPEFMKWAEDWKK